MVGNLDEFLPNSNKVLVFFIDLYLHISTYIINFYKIDYYIIL
ncbi:uncharacterized protein METZ01_LOCUS169204 [marine metagenome]|uniref:Uncharacterized protein n=1 Tax=marine metagenome TaxID=408172 RepID=A0A382BRA5_9ZZZZ